jgi:phytoene synthase
MTARELDAAGITDPRLRTSYDECRRLNAAHGRTYFLSTLLLPVAKRPHVHALYGFARYADEIVDDTASWPLADRRRRLTELAERFRAGDATGPVLPAVLDTAARWQIGRDLFEAFLASMAMDLDVQDYATWEDLRSYMHGSAAVIGLQLLPLLEPAPGTGRAAAAYARDLGLAFQLTNFIRDVGEDLDRGRVYLPKEDLAAFGVTRDDLHSGLVDGRLRRLVAFEVARARELFRSAEPGIRLLHPTSRDCIRTAFTLYAGILDAVERAGYDVLSRRAAVSGLRRVSVAAPALARARRARRARHPRPRRHPRPSHRS